MTTTFNVLDYLQDEEAIASYLAVVLEENDPDAFLEALGTVAKARSTNRPKKTGLNRESLDFIRAFVFFKIS